MRSVALLVCIVSIVVPGISWAVGDDAKKELDLLKGDWLVVSSERNGESSDRNKGDVLTIVGDKLTIKAQEREIKGTVKLDPAKKPKSIDLAIDEGGQQMTIQGIYVLEKDELKLCMAPPGNQERPKEFVTKAGEDRVLLKLKREKKVP